MLLRRPLIGPRLLIMMAGLLVWITPAQAHKVTVFAWAEGITIHTESKFSGGKRVKNGKIEVYDAQDRKLLDGLTDDQGRFSFSAPQKTDLAIRLEAGMGHASQWIVRADEIGTDSMAAADENSGKAPQPERTGAAEPPGTLPHAKTIDAQAIEQIVNQALDRKLTPLISLLAENRWQWRDVIAGIGYILGLMGLAAYVHYRKQDK